jgi:peptidyl-prolyl cis-trans isomerase SurA
MIWSWIFASTVQAATMDRIAAVVNDDLITLSEVYEVGSDYIQDHIGTDNLRPVEIEVLETLIQRILVSQELESLGMDVNDEEIENALRDISESNGISRESLRSEVERSGLPWDAYQAEIRESIRQMKFNQLILQPRIVIDENALQESYRQVKQQQPDVIDLYGIFLENPPQTKSVEAIAESLNITVEDAQKRIDDMISQSLNQRDETLKSIETQYSSGTSFSALAKLYDQSGLANLGGAMGTFAQGQLRSDLETVAFGLKEGEISQPIDLGTGVYILYVGTRKKQDPPSFEKMRPQLLDTYYSERFEQEMDIWYATAKSRAAISIHLETP